MIDWPRMQPVAEIRALEPPDVRPACALLELAGLSGATANLGRYLAWQPSCGWGAVADGQLVGLVTVLRQGTVGFVGAMAVDPARQGAGLGRRLLDHAHGIGRRAGIVTYLLEATAAGEHLYRRLGYVAEHQTVVATRAKSHAAPATRIEPAAHAAIKMLDRAATGAVRDDMLDGLLAEGGAGSTIHAAGELVASGWITGERLGPVIARDPAAGRALFDRLAPCCRVVAIPEPNRGAIEAIASNGFTELRRLRRMRLGPVVPARVDWIWALASPGAG